MNDIILKNSSRKNKKYMAVVNNYKVHFGAKGYEDYTIHKDNIRKINYINRHAKREQKFWTHNKKNILKPSYWARYLLWEKPNLNDAIKFIENKQNVKIKNMIY